MFVNDIRNSFTEFLCNPSYKALFLSLGYSDTSAKVHDECVFFLLAAAAAAALVAVADHTTLQH